MSLRFRLISSLVPKLAGLRKSVTVEQLRQFSGPPPKRFDSVRGVRFREGELGGRFCDVCEPEGAARGDLFFVHGGGWVAGTPVHFRKLTGYVCREAALRGHAITYGLAPERPFPGGIEDALAAYRDLLDRGANPGRLVVAGESAGGAIALSMLLKVREAGLPQPAAAVLWWPGVDMSVSGDSVRSNRGKDLLTPDFVRMCASLYLAGADPLDPLASPLFAELEGLPPTYIQAGSRDLIVDDSRRLAARLPGAVLDIEQGRIHGFAASGDDFPESRAALDRVVRWLRGRLDARDQPVDVGAVGRP